MSLVLLAASAALAALPVARIGGLVDARSVALLVQKGDEVAAVACNDAGAFPDAAPDAIWTCGPLPPAQGPVYVGILRNGYLLDAGTMEIGGAGLDLLVDGSAVTSGARLVRASAVSNPGAATIVARASGLGEGSAPVVRLQSGRGGVEMMCRDDGVFPDDARNDAVHGCAGPAPDARAEVLVNGKDGKSRSYGTVSWDPKEALGFLAVDGAAGTSSSEPFAITPFRLPDVVASGGPSTNPEGPTPPEPGPDDTPPSPPKEAVERSPVATRESLPVGTTSPVAIVVAFALGAGGAYALGRRGTRLPPVLLRHPAPPLLPGGPTLGDGAVALRVARPVDTPAELAGALLPSLARQRRVVLVAPEGMVLPPASDGPVYRVAVTDCQEVEAAVRVLARTAGPPIAVLVVGDDTLTDLGAVAPDAVRKLREGLGAEVWLGVVGSGPAPGGLPAWTAEGPPWTLRPMPL
ncbi:MAG: hypothetical protein Q8P18_31100 [Pseudomonadota bacterium]|nr:hypothetical protein [Pseudomonadota bacterium]